MTLLSVIGRGRPALLTCAIAFAAGSSCDDSSAPVPDARLEGRVVDASANPAAGVAVSIVFEFESSFPGKQAQHARDGIADLRGTLLLHEIRDYTRRRVRLLFDGSGDPPEGPLSWDGTDDDGIPVPNGMYRVHIRVRDPEGNEQSLESPLLVIVTTPEALMRHRHATTDDEGRFSIPLTLFPLGEPVTIANDAGETLQTRIMSRVQVHALRPSATGIEHASIDVVVATRARSMTVSLTLP